MDPKNQLPVVRMSEAARQLVQVRRKHLLFSTMISPLPHISQTQQDALDSVLRYSRQHGIDFSDDADDASSPSVDSSADAIITELTRQGFLRPHVEEALQYCKTRCVEFDRCILSKLTLAHFVQHGGP